MSVDVQWTDEDPESGLKRFVCAEKFAGQWVFPVRAKRRENWITLGHVSRDLWEVLLDALERRYQRREGVSDEDLKVVRQKLANYRERPAIVDDRVN